MVVPFDQFQRYKHVEEIINVVRKQKTYSILEVGANEHKNLEKFLPNDKITYLDIEVPEHLKEDKQYINADATNMPEIPENSFDYVVALDVFEHIPKLLRGNFLKELHRVAKLGVIIAAPNDSNEVVQAEMRANEFYKQLYGTGFRWLEEHRENDLPNTYLTKEFYRKNAIEHVQFQHGSLDIWEKMMNLHFLFADKNIYHNQRFFIDQYYNESIYKYDYGQKNYRNFFVSHNEIEGINKIQNWIEERLSNAKSKNASENIHFLNWLEQQIKDTFLTKQLKRISQDNEIGTNIIRENRNILESASGFLKENNKILHNHSEQLKLIQGNILNEEEYGILLKSIYNDLSKEMQDSRDEILASNENISKQVLNSKTILKEEVQSIQKELLALNELNAELKQQLDIKDNKIRNLESLNSAIISTKGWKFLEKARKIKLFLKRNKTTAIPKVVNKVKQEGLKNTVQVIEATLKNEMQEESYHEWSMKRLPTEEMKNQMLKIVESFDKKPLISIVMPTYNTPVELLEEAINSLKNQIYSNWELCVCDDSSTNPIVWKSLLKFSQEDGRIKIIQTSENKHIAEATNLAISIATGEYIGFMDHDDTLTDDALYEIVKAINEKNPDLIYSDEDKLEMDGTYSEPFFKPNWSPHNLLALNYMCHFVVCKKELGDELGWLRTKYNGAQDYDFLLRLTDKCEVIHHIPKILYHWRKTPSSTAVNPGSKPYAHDAGKNAVLDFLTNKYGKKVKVDETDHLFVYNPRYNLDTNIRVSIIIPTKDQVKLLSDCINSILDLSTYQNYEIIILNNNSIEEETYTWFEKIQLNNKVKVVDAFIDFNWSKLNNLGIKESDGDVFIFLNNDIKVITPDWIERLAEKALLEDVGTVGGLLLYEDNTIQHAGVVLGLGGWADHVFKGMNPVHYGTPFCSPMVTRNVLASTGACLAISKRLIEDIGGFDEEFIICGSDVEISLRAFKKGYYNIYDPYVKLYHYESKTRDSFIPEIDFELSKIHYSPYRENGDPFYNENLSLESPQPKLR